MNKHSEVQQQKIIEIDIPELRVNKEQFRECPVCFGRGRDQTLWEVPLYASISPQCTYQF